MTQIDGSSHSKERDPLKKSLLAAIVENDIALVKKLLKKDPALATGRVERAKLYDKSIFHWLYVGDGPLHLAAAGYRTEIVRALVSAGADPNDASNHRWSTPLHYAADGYINGPAWDAKRQVNTVRCLIDLGADINIQDKNGATPLHRAVRTRCAAAVECLLQAGCDPQLKNNSGSTPFHLAVQNTGRGGSGTEEAIAAQRQIIAAFRAFRVSTSIEDGKRISVAERAKQNKLFDLLS